MCTTQGSSVDSEERRRIDEIESEEREDREARAERKEQKRREKIVRRLLPHVMVMHFPTFSR